ncbi:MAG TPA: hypothetical protein VGM56_20585 [Byssovorax sp.]|jgi:hypothetical protein
MDPDDKPRPARQLLPYARWEAISVRLLGCTPEAKVEALDELDVDVADYDASEARWSAAMLEQIVAGDYEGAKAYGAKCAEELERRKRAAAVSEEPDPSETLEMPLPRITDEPLPFHAGTSPLQSAPASPPPAAPAPPRSGAAQNRTVEMPVFATPPSLPFRANPGKRS